MEKEEEEDEETKHMKEVMGLEDLVQQRKSKYSGLMAFLVHEQASSN